MKRQKIGLPASQHLVTAPSTANAEYSKKNTPKTAGINLVTP
jgi:hypothetical protein